MQIIKSFVTPFVPFSERESVLGFSVLTYSHLKNVNWYFSSKQIMSITTEKNESPIV